MHERLKEEIWDRNIKRLVFASNQIFELAKKVKKYAEKEGRGVPEKTCYCQLIVNLSQPSNYVLHCADQYEVGRRLDRPAELFQSEVEALKRQPVP